MSGRGLAFRLRRGQFLIGHISTYRIFVASASLLLPPHLPTSPLELCRTTCTIFLYAARAAQAQGFFEVVTRPFTSKSGLSPRLLRLMSGSPR